MKIAVLTFWLLLAIKTVGFSQEKLFKAALPPVPESGFYKIQLRPEITGYTNPDFSDLRILDEKNREVPYLLERAKPEKATRFFRRYPIFSQTSEPKKRTTIIIQNPEKSKINNLGLLIKNTNVRKQASLSGSSDAQNWYALEEDLQLQSVSNPEETSEVKVLHFPLSDYEYYKLEINDSASAPLNILAAGYYDFEAGKAQYVEIPNLQFSRSDSLKKTFLWFTARQPMLIDKLLFRIDSTTFYRRNATVFVRKTILNRRNKKQEIWQPVQNFQLHSEGQNSVEFPEFRAQEFYLEIENADNPPLEVSAVQAFQLQTFLIAELRKKHNYELHFGNEKAKMPVYDLAHFQAEIPRALPLLEPLEITEIKKQPETDAGINQFFQQKALIWVVLVLVISLLGYMTYKMLQENSGSR